MVVHVCYAFLCICIDKTLCCVEAGPMKDHFLLGVGSVGLK
jgi:hypothetical protein